MSINKVLNRPMFRKEALRQGVLKPIKARVGRYIQQGPLMQQGPGVAPGPYSRVPLTQQGPIPKSFSYNRRTGEYITDYGKKAIPRNIGRNLRGLGGVAALYGGASAAGVPDPLLTAIGATEAASIPFAFGKGPASQTIARTLSAPSRFAYSNPISAVGLGALGITSGGTKSYFDEKELVRDYAKRNNISYRKAMDIFNRDLVFTGGRPMSEMRKSDVGKMILGANPAVGSYIRSGLKDTAPGGLPGQPTTVRGSKSEKEIASEMRSYFDQSKQYGRYFQDVDELVKKVKDKERLATQTREQTMMSPDDAMQVDQATAMDDVNVAMAKMELRNAIMAQHNIDADRASNIAVAVTEGDMDRSMIKAAAENDNIYETVPNYVNDPNHKEAIKMAKANEDIQKKINKETGTPKDDETESAPGGSTDQVTGDNDIDTAKQYANEGLTVNLKDLDPRTSAIDPKRVFLLKLAEGLLKGKTRQGGLAGAAEVFGTALGPAVDSSILVKMKNDEAYRDFAATVLDYNTELLKARNDILKDGKRQRGSISMGGKFFEAFQDKNTSQIFVVDDKTGEYREVSTVDATFFPEKDSAQYVDNIRLVADGALASKILEDQIALMRTPEGKTAIGASGLLLSFAETVGNLPGEIKDGITGALSSDFSMSNNGELSDEAFEKLQERADKALGKFEKTLDKRLKKDLSASETLGKLKVNARMLTYNLANALKDKDRLTNRDLLLIEELTGTLSTEPDEKIIQKYEELLRRVEQKNNLRLTKFYTMGYTPNDVKRILEPIQGQLIEEVQPDTLSMGDAFAAFGVQ
jgi:hypothetical protein